MFYLIISVIIVVLIFLLALWEPNPNIKTRVFWVWLMAIIASAILLFVSINLTSTAYKVIKADAEIVELKAENAKVITEYLQIDEEEYEKMDDITFTALLADSAFEGHAQVSNNLLQIVKLQIFLNENFDVSIARWWLSFSK